MDDGTDIDKVEWIRYAAVIRRGYRKLHLKKLGSRITLKRGQGGGGAISVEEMEKMFRIRTDWPSVLPRRVTHTNSAKAYKKLGKFGRHEAGALHDAFELEEVYEKMQYVKNKYNTQEKSRARSKVCEKCEVCALIREGSRCEGRDASHRRIVGAFKEMDFKNGA